MSTTYNCNLCQKEITKDKNSDTPKGWEIWKSENSWKAYEIPMGLESCEKIVLPKLVNKHPVEHQKLKTFLSKTRDLHKKLIKPIEEKQEEILWKFFLKKGKMFPHFMTSSGDWSSTWEICETCSSELENQTKSYQMDEIEATKIMNKFEEVWTEEAKEIISKFELSLSDSEKDEFDKEKRRFNEEFLKNKEKELNNKIIAERERERESKSGKDTDWKPWIIGGSVVGGIILVALIYSLFFRRGKKANSKK